MPSWKAIDLLCYCCFKIFQAPRPTCLCCMPQLGSCYVTWGLTGQPGIPWMQASVPSTLTNRLQLPLMEGGLTGALTGPTCSPGWMEGSPALFQTHHSYPDGAMTQWCSYRPTEVL